MSLRFSPAQRASDDKSPSRRIVENVEKPRGFAVNDANCSTVSGCCVACQLSCMYFLGRGRIPCHKKTSNHLSLILPKEGDQSGQTTHS